MLAKADLVVADVSGLNGNVMYELGLAHAMGKRTVIITQEIDELPFDLRPYRVNQYSTSFAKAPALAKKLAEIAQGVLNGTATFGNPVQDFAPDYIGRSEQVGTPMHEGLPQAETPVPDDDDMGLLDWSERLTQATAAVKDRSDEIAEATRTIGARVSDHSEKLNQVTGQLGEKGRPTVIRMLRGAASDFDAFSAQLEESNPGLAAAVRDLGDSTNGIAKTRSAKTPAEIATIENEIRSLSEAEIAFESTYESVTGFAQSIADLPKLEQTLTRAVRRAGVQVSETAEIISGALGEFGRARKLLEQRLKGDS